MKKYSKKLAVVVTTLIVTCIIAITMFVASPAKAATPAADKPETVYGCNTLGQQACYNLMWNEDGTFISKDDFEQRFDEEVLDGLFNAEDKDYFLDMYDYCSERILNGSCNRVNSGGSNMNGSGGRGMNGGCGRGMGGGCGRR